MTYPPDPNNPYGQPPAAPGYGYPQQAPPQAAPGYGYPQQAPAYGYAPIVPPSMPGLMTTARVLLFIVGGVQTLAAISYVIIGAAAKDVTNAASRTTSDDNPFTALGDAAAGVLLVVGVLFGLFAALSITLGVKFGKGGNAVRVTTIVYGSLGALVGLLILLGAISGGTAVGLVMALLWLAISIIWITAMCVQDGVNWFNRPRY